MTQWILSSSSDRRALDIVDGVGRWDGVGPHYSRRTPGSRTFTGVGHEIVLITRDLSACWAVVRQRTPAKRGSGASRGRRGETDRNDRYVWRNMLFRRLGGALASELILAAVSATYREWASRYGALPTEVLRTEIDPRKVLSRNPGYSYVMAGFHNKRLVKKKIYLDAPCPTLLAAGSCACCPRSLLQSRNEAVYGA